MSLQICEPFYGAEPANTNLDALSMHRNNGTALSRVAGTAAGLFGTVQGFWGSSTPASNGLDTILSASFDEIAFDPRMYVRLAIFDAFCIVI